jgi:hypothetical protein
MLSAFYKLRYLPCSHVSGRIFSSPGNVIAVSYNGILLRKTSPLLGYSVTGSIVTLQFDTEIGDRVDAFCVLV